MFTSSSSSASDLSSEEECNKTSIISLEDIKAARARIAPFIHRTPIMTSAALDELAGLKLYFKCENFQKTGAFKARGAANGALKALQRDPLIRINGLVTTSSGNHGLGLAHIGRALGVPCTVLVPHECTVRKREMIAAHGAKVVPVRWFAEGVAVCEEMERDQGVKFISTSNNVDVIAGQGTMVLEMMEDLEERLDAILVATCGGGMLAGCAVAAKALQPSIKVIPVQPEGKNMEDSLAIGKRLWGPYRDLPTSCEALKGEPMSPIPFEVAKDLVERDVVTVSDAEMVAGMRLAADRMKIVIEMSAGAAVAAALKVKRQFPQLERVGVILCGGNADASFCDLK